MTSILDGSAAQMRPRVCHSAMDVRLPPFAGKGSHLRHGGMHFAPKRLLVEEGCSLFWL